MDNISGGLCLTRSRHICVVVDAVIQIERKMSQFTVGSNVLICRQCCVEDD